jgi:regulatory protein YycH of two-component signal transduction system YycFG
LKKWIMPSLLVMAITLSGCSFGKGVDQSFDVRNANKGDKVNNFTGHDGRRSIGNDITNQNPNFLNLRGTRNGNVAGNSQSHSKDVSKARQVIRDTHEFTDNNSVWINGSQMYVTVNKKGQLSGRQRLDAENRLYKKLRLALPRYTIKVTVH